MFSDNRFPDNRVKNGNPIRRRTLLGAAMASGLLSVTAAPTAAAASPIPKLPGELSRTSAVTAKGVPYENITVSINGDKAQLFVPHTAIPNKTVVGVIWYYHATGSTYSALNSAYKYSAELSVDQGAVCFCPNYGGSLWVNATAVNHQAAAIAYLKSVFVIGLSFLRGNSGGGGLMCWAYGKNLIPGARGMYLANAAYDMAEVWDRAPERIAPSYNYDRAAMEATNPARLDASVWKGKRIRVVVSDAANPDPVLPAEGHGLALVAKSAGLAVENSILYHSLGHQIPSAANKDMIAAFNRWKP